jgi:hypothetical protein
MGLMLSALLTLSLLVRGLGVTSLPPELFGDEIDVGYQAYSLFKTGRDLYSQPFPVYIHSLSEWRTPLLMYYTVPTIAVFGHTELGVRAPEVILGALAPLILFLLVYQVSKSKSAALLSGLVLALMPWHILYSRAAFESVLLLDFIMLGTILFLRRRWFISLVFFSLTPYIYSTATLFTPLWLISLYLFTSRPRIRITSLLPLLLLLPFAVNLFFGKAGERFGKVGLFNNKETVDEIVNLRTESAAPWERLFSNKVVFTVKKVAANYYSAFSPEFLFLKGDTTARHSLQYIGQLFPLWAPLFVFGLIYLIKHKQYFWLLWLAIAPIPSALTVDGAYHATRLFLMIPPLAVAVASGFLFFRDLLSRKLFSVAFGIFWLVFAFQLFDVANYYYFHYPQKTWRWWHVGYKQALLELNKLSPEYSRVFINNTYEPSLIRFLFYSGYDPRTFQRDFVIDKPKADVSPGYYGFALAPKYYFGGFSPPQNKSLIDVMQPGNIYMVSQRDDLPGDWDWRKNPPGGIKVLFTSTDPTGFPIFYLVTKV